MIDYVLQPCCSFSSSLQRTDSFSNFGQTLAKQHNALNQARSHVQSKRWECPSAIIKPYFSSIFMKVTELYLKKKKKKSSNSCISLLELGFTLNINQLYVQWLLYRNCITDFLTYQYRQATTTKKKKLSFRWLLCNLL